MKRIKSEKKELTILWMYPDLMNTYGDRGNIIVLDKRTNSRGIISSIILHNPGAPVTDIERADMVFMGGAQDRQQEIVAKDLVGKKGKALKKLIEQNVPGLFICGAYQFLGNFYKAADGTKIPGLSIFDVYTEHPGDQKKRLIGNCVVNWKGHKIVGFENHGGRTYLGKGIESFAQVETGSGNNNEDGTEGVQYKNAIGSYLHGPILPKNPILADWLIQTALEQKYNENITLNSMDDHYVEKARNSALGKFK